MLALLAEWTEAGLPPDMFWGQTVPTYNAAMAGALRARRDRYEVQRDIALLTAYYSGNAANWDWSKRAPKFAEWLQRMTRPAQPISSAERLSAFAALAAHGFDITITKH